jgi:uncharacterized protein YdiU (UPF0061 family)
MQILSNEQRLPRVALRKHTMSIMCAAAILCCGEGALAQTIYKQMDATGHTTFTDRPAADSMLAPYATTSSQERSSVSPPRIARGTRSDLTEALFSNPAMTPMHAATVDYNEATRRLTQARQSRQEGIAPRPGERADNAGASAMNTRYQRRQQRLQRDVVAAELRSQQTSLVRNTLSRSRRD